MIRLVEEAQEKRAPTQRFIDRFSQYYTPAVVVIAALVALVPTLVFGQPFIVSIDPTAGWLYRALTLLVVACPCALVISTPVTLVSAISNGARNGVLFKGGVHIESLSKVKAIAFDKTGTLTRGQPSVVAYRSIACASDSVTTCDPCNDLLALASAVERRSQHPLALAVQNEAAGRGLIHRYPAASAVTALTGRGVTGQVNGQQVLVGSHGYFDQTTAHPAEHCTALAEADARGQTTMLVSNDATYLGYIAVADTVRESSRAALAELKAMGLRHLVMLTGDNRATADVVAAQVGVTEVMANCLPEDKLDAVAALRAALRRDRDGGGWHQRRAGAGRGHGGHRHRQQRAGHGDGRCDADARQPAAATLCHSPQPRRHAHRLGQRDPEPAGQVHRVCAGAGRHGEHVAGGAGGRGNVAAGDAEWHEIVAPASAASGDSGRVDMPRLGSRGAFGPRRREANEDREMRIAQRVERIGEP